MRGRVFGYLFLIAQLSSFAAERLSA
ncbi:MAG: hypothetical protein JWQ35_1903, partial [Bacteriovoracaceae bacterium]|nr:hypothetical protein [Bacteriovoracaceae bacterium]